MGGGDGSGDGGGSGSGGWGRGEVDVKFWTFSGEGRQKSNMCKQWGRESKF